ncbi:ParA family protein [Natronomonas salina]|uniref:MinD/ParA family ATP-binding protein n=1 Tax=Natronomonas salina TaxID=1710540 RepID=UPI0015B64EB5|nr:ParA family protein [Natronomonas salina]QLD90497.1 ParA family protein [Natronomonas salina]
MATETCAFVGAAGGAGTTRVTLECAALLAREGSDVAVLDAAYGTQGLADRIPGRVDPDVTALCLDDRPLEEGFVDPDVSGAGRLAVCPARAPFERLARAKAPEAAAAFGDRIDEAARAFDHVLVDTPPVAANQAVAAVTGVEQVAVVCDANRAAAAVPRAEDRLADVGIPDPVTVVTRAEDHPDADVAVPTFEGEWPAVSGDESVHDAFAAVLGIAVDVAVEPETGEGLRSKFPV